MDFSRFEKRKAELSDYSRLVDDSIDDTYFVDNYLEVSRQLLQLHCKDGRLVCDSVVYSYADIFQFSFGQVEDFELSDYQIDWGMPDSSSKLHPVYFAKCLTKVVINSFSHSPPCYFCLTNLEMCVFLL